MRRVGDAIVPDRIAAQASRLRASLRGAGRGARDLAGLVAEGIRSAARRLHELWLRLTLRTRRIVAGTVGLAAVLAIAWLLVVPVLPCQLPGGDRCPPHDDAAELVPADALAYLHTNLSSDSDQYQEVSAFATRLPLLSAQLAGAAPLPGGGNVDFVKQIEPWLGGEVALSVIAAEGGAPAQVYLLEEGNPRGAEGFASELVGAQAKTSKRAGIEIDVGRRDVATASVGGFLVIGTEVGVQRVADIFAGNGRSLADSEVSNAIADQLPDDSLIQAYLSADGAKRLLAGNRGPLSSLDSFVNFDATLGAGAALVASPDGLELDIHSELDPSRLKADPGFFDAFPPFEPKLPEDLAPRTLAYLGLGDPAGSVQHLLEQAQSQAPDLVAGFDEFSKRLRHAGDVSVESDILPLLGGEAAFGIEPPAPASGGGRGNGGGQGRHGASRNSSGAPATASIPGVPEAVQQLPGAPPSEAVAPQGEGEAGLPAPPTGPPYLTFIGTGVDPASASETLAKLQVPLAKALVPQAGQAPTFEERTLDGVDAHSVRISPTVDLTYAIFDAKLVVSTQPEGVERVAAGPAGLSDAELYGRATDGFSDSPSLLLYLNLGELIGLAEQAGLADVTAYLPFAAEARRLAAAALAVERGDATLDTQARLTLSQ